MYCSISPKAFTLHIPSPIHYGHVCPLLSTPPHPQATSSIQICVSVIPHHLLCFFAQGAPVLPNSLFKQLHPEGLQSTKQTLNRHQRDNGWRYISFHLQVTKGNIKLTQGKCSKHVGSIYYCSIVSMYLTEHILVCLGKNSYYSGGTSQVSPPQYCQLNS